MSAPLDTKLQQSLVSGQAWSLHPCRPGVLRIRLGRAWATLDETPRGYGSEAGDHCLEAGQELAVRADCHLVIESLNTEPVHFEWKMQPQHLTPWEEGVALPLADLSRAARLAARALWRLLRGLAAYAPQLLGAGLLMRRR